jgi:hypothetical protein
LAELQREREALATKGAPDTGRREQQNPPRPNYRTTGPQGRFAPRETT